MLTRRLHNTILTFPLLLLLHPFKATLTQAFTHIRHPNVNYPKCLPKIPQTAFTARSNIIAKKNRHTPIRSKIYDDDDFAKYEINSFNPLNIPSNAWDDNDRFQLNEDKNPFTTNPVVGAGPLAALTAVALSSTSANADASSIIGGVNFDPQSFQPVCPASDGFYRILKGASVGLVGEENIVEYGPLIAGGLLRIRLELCVVESFFNEAVGPFISKNGLSWVLPLHETVETFLAGTIFAFVTTFILVGSTKLVTVFMIFFDAFIGGPLRFFGGFAFDRARGVPVTLDVGFGPFKARLIGPTDLLDAKGEVEKDDSFFLENVPLKKYPAVLFFGIFKLVGEALKLIRDVLEGTDLFIGRYLIVVATAYVGVKFLHFKVFPDFPPF